MRQSLAHGSLARTHHADKNHRPAQDELSRLTIWTCPFLGALYGTLLPNGRTNLAHLSFQRSEWRDLPEKTIYKQQRMLQGLVRVTGDVASVQEMDRPAGTAGERYGAGAKGKVMWRLVKLLVILAVLAALGLILYAYLGPFFFPADFAAPVEQVTEPVTLKLD